MARPRSEEARRKALAAATDLIVERGVGNLTIEEVAARSGVAKTTIYRHWPERGALILDTARVSFEHVATPDTGSLRGDLDAWFGGMVRADLSGKFGQIMPCLIDAAASRPGDRPAARPHRRRASTTDRGDRRTGAGAAASCPPTSTRGWSSARSSGRSCSASWSCASRSTPPTSAGASTWPSPACHTSARTVRLAGAQPTEPSICSSIRRLHSTAYSIGSVRVIGSMKPLTTMPIACSSERPRLIR